MAPNPKPASDAAAAVSGALQIPSAAIRTVPPATPFPTSASGPHISAAIAAVAARTQSPPELVVHHLLTLAAMAAQRLVSIRLPTGPVQPVSCYFLTIVGSGEGRSAAENMCVGPVRFWQRRFTDHVTSPRGERMIPTRISLEVIPDFHILTPAPDVPPAHAARPFEFDQVFLSLRRAGVNDRYDRYARFGRRSGLFAGVATDLLTPSPARRAEAGSLSALWDGGVIATGVEGAALSPRLSVHLVAGAGEGLALLRAPEVAESGLLGRLLAVRPASRIGTRSFSEGDGAPPPELCALHDRLTDLYAREATCETRVVALNREARRLWLAFAHEAEAEMVEAGAFAPIRALAGRLAEHAARLAAIIALVDDPDLSELTPTMLDRGIALARFYAAEALRLSALRSPALADGDPLAALQSWLERKYAGQEITLREVYSFGPPVLRSAAAALKAMRQLELLGVAHALKQDGTPRGGSWQVSGFRDSAQQPAA
jgi:hypothetical protein